MPKQPGMEIFSLSEEKVLSTNWQFHSYLHDFKKNEITPVLIPSLQVNSSPVYCHIKDVKQLNDTCFIVGTQHGIFQFNSQETRYKKLQFYRAGKVFSNDITIDRIFIDKEKAVWLGFPEGIAHYRPFTEPIRLMRNNEQDKLHTWTVTVPNFCEDKKRNIWFGNGNGFAKWDILTDVITSYPPVQGADNRLSHKSVRGIVFDGKYLILGPTDKGLWLYEPETKSYQRPIYPTGIKGKKVKDASEHDFVDQIRTLNSGDHVVVGRDALYKINGKTYQLSFVDCPAAKENSNFVHEDLQKQIWIGTQKGLHCLDSNMKFLFKVQDSLGALHSFCIWNNNEIMVSGSRGIFSVTFSNGVIRSRSFHPFFKEMSVNLIYKDKNGKLWAGTNQGLYRIDSASRQIELFDYANNVQGNGFYYDASFVSSRNILYLGGVNGINYFIPENVPPLNHVLKTSIQKIRVNDNDSSYTTSSVFSLRPSQRSLEVSFTAPYYLNPNKVIYRYMMEGYNGEWKNVGNNNSVLFTSLPSGRFVFRVEASIDGLNWYEANETIRFSIALPFWKSWWFVLLVAAAIIATIYGMYRYQLHKQLEIERLRSRISRDLHDDIGSTLSSINILAKSSLTGFVKVDDDKLLLQKIQSRSQKMLDAMDDLIWNTKPEHDSLESLTVRMREYGSEVMESAGITFTVHCPATLNNLKLDMEQKKNIYLIFKEAINNLAKYSRSKTAFVDFTQDKDCLEMVIRDEGIGFIPNTQKNGNGLENMRSRAAEMNGKIQILHAANSGTTIKIQVPI